MLERPRIQVGWRRALLLLWMGVLMCPDATVCIRINALSHYAGKKCAPAKEKFARLEAESGIHRQGLSPGTLDAQLRGILTRIRQFIPKTSKAVQDDIIELNYYRVVNGMANFLGASFRALHALVFASNQLQYDKAQIPFGWKLQFVCNLMYGFGYSGQYVTELELPVITCGQSDLDRALSEFAFLNDSEGASPAVLKFYTTQLNHAMKRNLYCLIKYKGKNSNSKRLNALIDRFTVLQQNQIDLALTASPK